MLVACKVIRSESGAPITPPIILEGGLFICLEAVTALEEDGSGNWAPFSDLTNFQAAYIWCKLFSTEGFLYWIYMPFIKH